MSDDMVVNGIWIGERLGLLEQLSILSFQRQGWRVRLWLYDRCDGVPANTEIADAAEILPKGSIFAFEGSFPELPGEGKGSLSHWSDQFQLRLLYKYGGYYTQLDVSLLGALDCVDQPYAFMPHWCGIQTCFMKCPKGSAFARDCAEELPRRYNRGTAAGMDWHDSMITANSFMEKYDLAHYILPWTVFADDCSRFMKEPNLRPDPNIQIMHWANARVRSIKEAPQPGTYYEDLLNSVGLTDVTRSRNE